MSTEIKIYICMNEDGDYEANADQDMAQQQLDENYGGLMRRTVCISTTMSPPHAPETQAPAIPDEAGTTGPVEIEP